MSACARCGQLHDPLAPCPEALQDTLQSNREAAPLPPLAPGTLLEGVYRVERCIGHGAYGAVYVVEHTQLGRRFAAKVLRPIAAQDPDAAARLRAEARAASAIDHENIVDVVHLGTTPDQSVFEVMELLQGEDLRARLERQRGAPAGPHLPDDESRALAAQILRGLAAAHRAGVVHRDLKPENVFLAQKDGRVVAKLVDFGLSRLVQAGGDPRLTREGAVFGTPLYMPPEQARDASAADARSDLYAFGVLLFELVTGRVPFEAATVTECLVKHATEAPPRPTTLRPDLSPALEAVILRCLEKDPARRFGSADEAREALEAAPGAGGPGQVDVASPRRTGRRRAWWAAGAAFVAAGAVTLWAAGRAPPPSEAGGAGTVVFVPFENVARNEELSWLGTGLAQALADGVPRGHGLNVADLPPTGLLEALSREASGDALLERVAETAGAHWIVSGRFTVVGDTVNLAGKVVGFPGRRVVRAVELTGSRANLLALQEQLAEQLVGQLLAHLKMESELLNARQGTRSLAAWEAAARAQELYRRDRGWSRANYAAARAFLEKALELDPDFVHARSRLAWLEWYGASDTLDPRLRKRAAELAEQVLARSPDAPSALSLQCAMASEELRVAEGLELCRRAVQHGANELASMNLAWNLVRSNRAEEGLAIMASLIADQPANGWLRLNRASQLLALGRVTDAEGDAVEVARLQDEEQRDGSGPTTRAGWFELRTAHASLAAIRIQQGRWNEAEAECELEERQSRGREHALLGHARLICAQVRLVAAVKRADAGLARAALAGVVAATEGLPPIQLAMTLNFVADAIGTSSVEDPKLLAEALPLAEQAVQLTDRKNPGVLDTLAQLYERLGRREDASRVNDEGLQLAPDAGYLLDRRGRLAR